MADRADLSWCLFGPVRLRVDDRDVDLGPAKQRCLLAVLLMTPGHTVAVETLIDRVWGDRPPTSARALAPHMARLRRLLDESAGTRWGSLRFTDGGYRLDCEPDLVDLHRARGLVAAARSADPARRADLLADALADWRPVALAGLAGDWAARTRATLARERLDVIAERAQACLALDRLDEVVEELRPVVAEHPDAEVLVLPFMTALAGVNRSAEALDAYAAARQRIADELGVEPSPALRNLHLRILRDDRDERDERDERGVHDGRGDRGDRTDRGDQTRVVPAQLPIDVAAFTGREAELAELDAAMRTEPGEPTAVVISAVSGTAGVGKTALAIRWANRVRQRFPDGQLYVNLRGYDPDQAMSAADVLDRFLTALGVTGRNIPLDLEERAARYRTELDGRQILIVLDNASTVEQVRPLLPGGGSSVVLVTSRDSLAGLIAVNGARRVELDLLSHAESIVLLRRLIGERASLSPATAALADLCVRLPLALRVAAELAISQPTTSLDDLVADLSDQRRRLRLLDGGGDPRAAVRSVFSWSVRRLPRAAAHAFGRLGLHPGPDFDVYAASALTGAPLEDSRQALDVLARAHLVQPVGPRRYTMHDLLRAYASSLVLDESVALTRLLDHYLSTAAAAMNVLYPALSHHRPPASASSVEFADAKAAMAWLDVERPAIASAVAYAAGHGLTGHAARISQVLFRYLVSGMHPEALALYENVRDGARAAGDHGGHALALHGIGCIYVQRGLHQAGIDAFRAELELFRLAPDPIGEGRALSNIGIGEGRLGRFRSAAAHHEAALSHFRRIGDRTGESIVLNNLGFVLARLGAYETATAHLTAALAIAEELSDDAVRSAVLNSLGFVFARLGRHTAAAQHFTRALECSRRSRNRSAEAHALTYLGIHHTATGDPARALGFHEQGLAVFREIAEPDGEARALNGIGEAAAALGRYPEALAQHRLAVAVASRIGAREQVARAHAGLGAAYRLLGSPDEAATHDDLAIALYEELGMPNAAEIAARSPL